LVASPLKRFLVEGAKAFGTAAVVVVLIAMGEAFAMGWVEGWPRVVAGIATYGAMVAAGTAVLAACSAPWIRGATRRATLWFGAESQHSERIFGLTASVAVLALTLPAVAAPIMRLEDVAYGVAWLLWTGVAAVTVSLGTAGVALAYTALRRRLPEPWRGTVHGVSYAALFTVLIGWLWRDALSLIDLLGWADVAAGGLILVGGFLGLALRYEKPVYLGLPVLSATAVLSLGAWNWVSPIEANEISIIQKDTFVLGHAMRRAASSLKSVKSVKSVKSLAASDGVRHCGSGQAIASDVGHVGSATPDILFVTLDGIRFDYTTAGGERDLTPHLNAWGKEGAVFTRAYTTAPSTRQSFRAIFTGLYPGVGGQPDSKPATKWGVTIPRGQVTLASYLQEAGFATTALVSKPKAFPRRGGGLRGFDAIDKSAAKFLKRQRYSASYVVNQIIGMWAEPHRAGSPRFLWTHIMDAHGPYRRPPSVGPKNKISKQERYEWSIRYLDQEMDRLLRWARSPERKDNTWVILTSDHGEAWSEHKNRRHGSTSYEEEIHVPLMVWGPGVKTLVHRTPVSLIDLLPTLLDTAGLKVPDGLCGESLLGGLKNGTFENRPVLVATVPDKTRSYHHLAWIQGDQKLIVDGQLGLHSLYDLASDPDEKHDLAQAQVRRTQRSVEALRTFLTERQMDPAVYGLASNRQAEKEAHPTEPNRP
jgi:choline-sulfatase